MNGLTATALPLCLVLVGPDSLTELAQVLERAGLPGGDVHLPGRRFFRAADAGGLVGFGGLEGERPDLLPRSVVVHPDSRGFWHGTALVRALEAQPATLDGGRLHLLTMTATAFFLRLGYASAKQAILADPVARELERRPWHRGAR